MSDTIWHPLLEEGRCDFYDGGYYSLTPAELCYKSRKCIYTDDHEGPHEVRLEREDETDEQYLDWYIRNYETYE